MNNNNQKIQFGVGAVIVDEEGKIFLAKRGHDVSINAGRWEPPGGRLEFGETLAAALQREMMEEHGVEIEILDEIGTAELVLPEENSHWVGPAFVCKIVFGTPKICEPDKCTEMGWFTLEEAEKLDLTEFAEVDLRNYRRWIDRTTLDNA